MIDDTYADALRFGRQIDEIRLRGDRLAQALQQKSPVADDLQASVTSQDGALVVTWRGYVMTTRPRVVDDGRSLALEWKFVLGSGDDEIECARFYQFADGIIAADVLRQQPILQDGHPVVLTHTLLHVLAGLLRSKVFSPEAIPSPADP